MQVNPTRWPILLLPPGTLLYFYPVVVRCLQKGDQAMPILEKERQTAPRSALRYRPITTGPAIARARKSHPDAYVTTAPVAPDDLDREEQSILRRRLKAPTRQTHAQRHVHPLLFIGLGTLITVLLWVGVTQLMIWGTNQYNALVYGSPRTFQIDAVVGQNDSAQHPSHFVAINLHGVVTILDFPAGDASHLRELASFSVPGPSADQAVAILRFIDFEHNGRPTLLITINGVQSMLVNDGDTFRQPTPTEQQRILQEIQQMNR